MKFALKRQSNSSTAVDIVSSIKLYVSATLWCTGDVLCSVWTETCKYTPLTLSLCGPDKNHSPGMGHKVINRDVYCLSLLDVPQSRDYEVVVKCIYREGERVQSSYNHFSISPSIPTTKVLSHTHRLAADEVKVSPAGDIQLLQALISWNTWVVEVELAFESLGLLLWGEDPVEAVLAQDGHLPLVVVDLILPQQLHNLAAHRRLATTGRTRQAAWWNTGPFLRIWEHKGLPVQIKRKKSAHLRTSNLDCWYHIWARRTDTLAVTHTQNKRLQFTPHSDNTCGRTGAPVSSYSCGGKKNRGIIPGSQTHKQLSAEPQTFVDLITCKINLLSPP